MITVFLTHDPEDLNAYYGRALPELRAVADVVINPNGRDLTTAELIVAAAGCDVIVAHRSTPGEAALFASSPDLIAFLRTAVDISTVDVGAASAAGVLVARADKSFVPSTAEIALALLLDVARHVSDSTLDYRRDVEPPQRTGFQLRGRTAGMIGYGSIARYLAPVLQALGMTVIVNDPAVEYAVRADGYEHIAFDALLARADVVLPLAASVPETENIIDAAAISQMRPGTVLVNVSRGELMDEDAVEAALDSGHLGGLAMDVGRAADQRPSPALARRPDVVATPHLGGLTSENADAQARSSVDQVRAIIAGEMPPRAVNPEHAERLRHWWQP
ncbi:MAG: NAD(P)-dependent oxidoreductase [Ilumatobacteraceae bacterium]